MDGWDVVVVVAALLGALEGAGIARRTIERWWRRGPGRRRSAERTLQRLGVGCHVSYFDGLLGPAPFRHRVDDTTEHVWVDDLFYVHAICRDDVVVQWVATTRSAAFKPTFAIAPSSGDPTTLTLQVTPFASAGDPVDDIVHAQVGARRISYWEAHYRGNPGNYCTFLLGGNDAGASLSHPAFVPVAATTTEYSSGDNDVDRFRQSVAPNSFGVALLDVICRDWLGADADLVRLLP